MTSPVLQPSARRSRHRALWGKFRYWRYKLFDRNRHDQLALERVLGEPLLVLPTVFNPRLLRTGEFLARYLTRSPFGPDAVVLDMGTGSGIGALFAARIARRVVAVDLNAEAVRCARVNALVHHLEDRIEVRQGDLFEPVRSERFDVVMFNPPFYRGAPTNARDLAWRGVDVIERFASQLRAHLADGGYALLVFSTDNGVPDLLDAFRAHGFAHRVVAETDFINEVITVHRFE